MKNTKLLVKFFLIIALFTSTALADGHMGGGNLGDGHMGGGNRTCDPQTQNCVPTCNPQTQSCLGDDEPGDEDGEEGENLFFSYVSEFLASLLG